MANGNGNNGNGDSATHCAHCNLRLQPACRIMLPDGRAVHQSPTCAQMRSNLFDAYARYVKPGMSNDERQAAFARAEARIAGPQPKPARRSVVVEAQV